MRYVLAAFLTSCVLGVPALAQNNAVKIGVLDDMSGVYADNTGPGDVQSVKFAIEDFGGSVLGKPIEMVSADFQNKVDVGVGIAKRWYDEENVDLVLGVPNSAVALALVKVADEKNRVFMPTAAATSAIRPRSHWCDGSAWRRGCPAIGRPRRTSRSSRPSWMPRSARRATDQRVFRIASASTKSEGRVSLRLTVVFSTSETSWPTYSTAELSSVTLRPSIATFR